MSPSQKAITGAIRLLDRFYLAEAIGGRLLPPAADYDLVADRQHAELGARGDHILDVQANAGQFAEGA